MNYTFSLLILLFSLQTGFIQSCTYDDTVRVMPEVKDIIFAEYDTPPKYPGGSKALAAYLKRTVQYPEAASRANVKGAVLTAFVIDSAGFISDVSVLKGLGYGCDEEALRVVRAMPRWKPYTLYGKPVAVKYFMPVRFPFS